MSACRTLNRIAPYLRPAKPTLTLPATREGREQALADGVFSAVLALQGLLTDSDPAVVLQAAAMMLDFEKTRLRHGRAVAGTEPSTPIAAVPEPTTPACKSEAPSTVPQPNDDGEELDAADMAEEEFVRFVDEVRARLQKDQDESGTGGTVSWEQAEQVAYVLQSPQVRRQAGIDSPSG